MKHDPIIRIAGLAFAGLFLAYLLPGIPEASLAWFHESWADIGLLGLTILAILKGHFCTRRGRERRFWTYMIVGLSFWLLARVFYLVFPEIQNKLFASVIADGMYLAFYLLIVLAIEASPHIRKSRKSFGLAQTTRSSGGIIFSLGLLAYFVLIPSQIDQSEYATLLPSLYLFVAMDIYLAIRFGLLSATCTSIRWRHIYRLLTFTATIWVIHDALEALHHANLIHVVPGSPTELIWYLPYLSLICAARMRHQVFTPTSIRPIDNNRWPRVNPISPLLLQAAAFPLIHFALYGIGALDQPSRPAREAVVMFELVLLGTLALVQHRYLEKRNSDLRRDLRAANEQLQHAQKMDALGQLAGGVAHDFNNILTVIQGYSDSILQELDKDHWIYRDLLEVKCAGEKAATLTRQLLAFSSKQPLSTETLDLHSILRGMQRMLSRLLGEGIELQIKLDNGNCHVESERGHLEQIIMNLVVNARDAMPDGGRIVIGTCIDEEKVKFQVADDGCGMDAKTRQRIFEPFFTTRPRGKGTGLGLSTVYGIVVQLGGSVTVDSQQGVGTTFEISLPRVPGPTTSHSSAEEHRPGKASGNETLLLIEDEKNVLVFASRILERQGYRVLEAPDGSEALKLSEEFSGNIDLVLSDVVMPRMSGPDFARKMSSLRPETKILFMSGYLADHSEALPSGGSFLQKPFTSVDLVSKVRQMLTSA